MPDSQPIKPGSPEWLNLPWLECLPLPTGGNMGIVRLTVDGTIPLEIRGAGNSPFEAIEAAITTTRQTINQLALMKEAAKNN